METQWKDWLAAERTAGRGGLVWPEPMVRGLPFTIVLPVPLDVTGDAFKMGFAPAPDAPELVTKTATLGAFADGVTEVTIALTEPNVATIGASQTDGDLDGLAEVLAELLYQEGASGDWRRSMVISIPISGNVADV